MKNNQSPITKHQRSTKLQYPLVPGYWVFSGAWLLVIGALFLFLADTTFAADRLRLVIETDAGGDPDDEQSLVRFLLYANEWDVEGIIANRPNARDSENRNPERTGLGIVRRLLNAYGQCYTNLVANDPRYPTREYLWQRTVAGYNGQDDAVNLVIAAVDRGDALWYSDWGTDHGAATNNMLRALDRVLSERGHDQHRPAIQTLGEHVSAADGWEALVSPVFCNHEQGWWF